MDVRVFEYSFSIRSWRNHLRRPEVRANFVLEKQLVLEAVRLASVHCRHRRITGALTRFISWHFDIRAFPHRTTRIGASRAQLCRMLTSELDKLDRAC